MRRKKVGDENRRCWRSRHATASNNLFSILSCDVPIPGACVLQQRARPAMASGRGNSPRRSAPATALAESPDASVDQGRELRCWLRFAALGVMILSFLDPKSSPQHASPVLPVPTLHEMPCSLCGEACPSLWRLTCCFDARCFAKGGAESSRGGNPAACCPANGVGKGKKAGKS
jgi:hypothetical protein